MAKQLLNKRLRDQLREILAVIRHDSMFGDNQEAEYIMDGLTLVGLNQMSDRALIRELDEMVGDNLTDEQYDEDSATDLLKDIKIHLKGPHK